MIGIPPRNKNDTLPHSEIFVASLPPTTKPQESRIVFETNRESSSALQQLQVMSRFNVEEDHYFFPATMIAIFSGVLMISVTV